MKITFRVSIKSVSSQFISTITKAKYLPNKFLINKWTIMCNKDLNWTFLTLKKTLINWTFLTLKIIMGD